MATDSTTTSTVSAPLPPVRANAATVIGASAMLAYLFIPFRSGCKPPFSHVLGHFAVALSVVVVSTRVLDR